MDVPGELPLAVPLLCTLLALVLASLFVKLRGAPGPRAAAEPGAQAAPPQEAAAPAEERDEGGRVPVEEVGAGGEGKAAAEPGPPAPQREPEPQAEPEAEPEVERKAEPEPEREAEPEPEREAEREAEPEVRREAPPGAPRRQEDAQGREEDLGLGDEKLAMEEPEEEDAADEPFSFKYSPGKLRGNKYKSMMTKEELEEEQRVQREQLAAIFRLMKEKSDTFGEMSEGDMKEQLRLYDI